MMNNNKKALVLVVSAVLINVEKKILMQKRPKGKSFSGFWELPGGKVELYESLESAIIRELKEELDINLKQKDLKNFTFVGHEYNDFYLLMPVYKCEKWTGSIKKNENQKTKFCDINEIKKMKILEADSKLIEPLELLLS